jgi:hypothetical protein
MTRRFEVGPILVALGAILLLVSLFLEWYGPLTAWQAFEVVEVLLAALAVAALVVAAGQIVAALDVGDRRWLPGIVGAVAVLVAAELLDPPPAAGNEAIEQGLWLAFAAALIMLAGAVLTVGRISFAIAVEGRELRERVAVLDHRQETTETAPVTPVEDEGAARSSKRLLGPDDEAAAQDDEDADSPLRRAEGAEPPARRAEG